MIVKPAPAPADSTKVCKTCGHYDLTLQICCARDMLVTKADAEQWTCGDWNPKEICITCDHFDPDTNQCWFEEHDMSEEESLTRTCESWEPRKEKRKEQLPPGACCFNCEHRDKMSLKCKLKLSDAVLTVERSQHEYCDSWEREQDHGVTLRVADPEEGKKQKSTGWDHRLEAKAFDRGAKQGMTLEALETVFAIACQQVPSMEKRWMELKGEINVMFAQKWAAEDMPE